MSVIASCKNPCQLRRIMIQVANFDSAAIKTSESGRWMHTQPEDTKQVTPMHWSKMPGFKNLPVVGGFLGMLTHKDFTMKKSHTFFETLIKEFGPIFRINSGLSLPSMVVITDTKDIEKFLRSTLNNPVRFHFASLKAVRKEAPENYFNNKGGLLPENSEEWWRVRSRTQGPLLKPQNIRRYLQAMDEVALEFVEKVASLQEKNGEMPENFQKELYKWGLESISLIGLNRRLGCLADNLPDDSSPVKMINAANGIMENTAYTEMFQLWRLFATTAYKRLKKSHEVLQGLVDAHIQVLDAQMKEKPESDESELSLMESLLQTPGIDRTDVTTLILDMIMAGIDTTSHSMGFLLYVLAKNPDKQRKLQAELDSILGDGNETMNEKHLAKMSYLKACVKESLRMYPVVLGIMRVIQEDLVLSGYLIPKGWEVFSFNYYTSRDESVFAHAKEFLPERWQRDQPHGTIHRFASLPFSHGTRSCIGRRIAEQEIFTLTARLLHRFNVEYKYGEMGMVTRLVGMPEKPLKFNFTERRA